MDAKCVRTCYDSSTSTLYEQGKIYEVDPKDKFIAAHFDVPKPKGKDKEKDE